MSLNYQEIDPGLGAIALVYHSFRDRKARDK